MHSIKVGDRMVSNQYYGITSWYVVTHTTPKMVTLQRVRSGASNRDVSVTDTYGDPIKKRVVTETDDGRAVGPYVKLGQWQWASVHSPGREYAHDWQW
jgi:hypothetical protein